MQIPPPHTHTHNTEDPRFYGPWSHGLWILQTNICICDFKGNSNSVHKNEVKSKQGMKLT